MCYSQTLTFRLSPSPDHLRLWLWPKLSPRRSGLLRRSSRRCLRLFFAVASHPPARFITGRLRHPRRRDWLSFAAAFISTVRHRRLIVASSPALDLAVLLRRWRSPPPVLRSPSPSPPSPPSDRTCPPFVVASFGHLLSPVAIVGRLRRYCLCLGRPRTPFQGVYPEFFSRIISQFQPL